jgi:hypothetical protein
VPRNKDGIVPFITYVFRDSIDSPKGDCDLGW